MNQPILLNKLRILFLAAPLIISACSKKNLVALKSSLAPNCVVNSNYKITNAPCTLKFNSASDQYFYETENGGLTQITAQTLAGTLITGSDGKYALQSVIPDGYVSTPIAITLKLSDVGPSSSSLSSNAANIKNGVTIFGVVGTYATSTTLPNCVADVATNPECLGTGFVYNTQYNGRTGNCSGIDDNSDTTVAASCFLTADEIGKQTDNSMKTLKAVKPSELSIYPFLTTDYTYYSIYNSSVTATVIPRIPKDFYFQTGSICSQTPGAEMDDCLFVVPATANSNSINFVTPGTSTGAGSCDENGVQNTSQCFTQGPSGSDTASRYVYTQKYNGYDTECTAGMLENCFISSPTKVDYAGTETVSGQALDLLRSENIKADVTILGVPGSAGGENDWPSNMHRMQGLPYFTLTQESAGSSKLAVIDIDENYQQIPKITNSNDGNTSSVTPVYRTGWGTCGDSSFTTIDLKIKDCSRLSGSTWSGLSKGNAGQTTWKLVMRTGTAKEIWKDTATGMLWSSLVSTGINWCQATGAHSISGLRYKSRTADDSASTDAANICDNSLYQNTATTFVSACMEISGETSNPTSDLGGKLGLTTSTTPRADWRTPTLYDYEIAEAHGIRFVMPDMGLARSNSDGLFEWTATLDQDSTNLEKAFAFHSRYGYHNSVVRSTSTNGVMGVRCIGQSY